MDPPKPLTHAAPRPAAPHRLEYFADGGPGEHRTRGGVVLWSAVLAAGWLPYTCGILNAVVVAQSYSPPIIHSHRWGAGLFLGAGLALSVLALAGFVRLRHGTGIRAAATAAGAQIAVGSCLGLAA